MQDWRIEKIECAIKVLIKKGLITEKEIGEEYDKVFNRHRKYEQDDDIYHR